MKRDIDWPTVAADLHEALWSLRELTEAVDETIRGEREKPFTEGALAVDLEHIFGHLCWAWNGRRLPPPHQSFALMDATRQWPREETFHRLWPKSAWRLMKGRLKGRRTLPSVKQGD